MAQFPDEKAGMRYIISMSLPKKSALKEIRGLEKIIAKMGDVARVDIVENVQHGKHSFPLHVIELGSQNPEDPVIAYFGGVHGLEKIGSEVIMSYLDTIASLQKWDEAFQKRLRHSRMLFMPMVNPVGIYRKTRSNGNGVDLMRNSPSQSKVTSRRLYSGHRISPALPWYRGEEGRKMEKEAEALCKVVRERIFPSKLSMAIDVHSGFGAMDRFWFPYSRSEDIFPHIAEVEALRHLFSKTYPNHFYKIEPVSSQYTIDGDLWDYLVDEFYDSSHREAGNFFLPWTLEMGSWIWLKKNPLQIINKLGLYHPLLPHRRQRILRRHLTLFDFLHRSVLFPRPWMKMNQSKREDMREQARRRWYLDVEDSEEKSS